jgi:hypothetical protein
MRSDSLISWSRRREIDMPNKEDYAYTPGDEHSYWKLNISDARHVAEAKAALGSDFRGNPVEIPVADRPAVIAKVNEAAKKFGLEPYLGD